MKKLYWLIWACWMGMMVLSPVAWAQREQVVLAYRDQVVPAEPNTLTVLALKKDLRRQYPRLELRGTALIEAQLVVQPLRRPGLAQLVVGAEASEVIEVPVRRKRFSLRGRRDFQRIRFANPSADSDGPWQILLDGSFLVREVVLYLAEYAYPPRDLRDRPAHGRYGPDDHRASPYGRRPHEGPGVHRRPPAPKKKKAKVVEVALPARIWGTDVEGDRTCGQGSNNAPDGWNHPQNVCRPPAAASYAEGYPPVKLYIRPGIGPISDGPNADHVRKLKVMVTAIAKHRTPGGRHFATLGVDIGGKGHSERFSLAPAGVQSGQPFTHAMTIKGKWRRNELARAKIWVRPNHNSVGFKVRQLKINVFALR